MNQEQLAPEISLPASPQAADTLEMRRRYSFTMWVAAVACSVYGVAMCLFGYAFPVAVVDFAVAGLMLVIMRWALVPEDGSRLTAGVHLMAFFGVLFIGWHAWHSGLGDATITWFFGVIPIAVALLGNMRTMAIWTLIALISVVALHGTESPQPAGSMIVGVTKIIRFFFCEELDSLRNKRPTSGRSPRTGTLSFSLVTFSAINPPSTTVWPSQTIAEVVTWRTRK